MSAYDELSELALVGQLVEDPYGVIYKLLYKGLNYTVHEWFDTLSSMSASAELSEEQVQEWLDTLSSMSVSGDLLQAFTHGRQLEGSYGAFNKLLDNGLNVDIPHLYWD